MRGRDAAPGNQRFPRGKPMVDALISEAEVNRDVGITILKREDQPADMQHAEGRGAGYSDRAGRRAARASRLIGSLLDEAQDMNAVRVIAAAFLCQRDTPGGSAEQRHTDRFLKLAHMPRD